MLNRFFRAIREIIHEIFSQIVDLLVYICSPRNILIVFTLISVLSLSIYLCFLAMKFDYMNTITSRSFCYVDNQSIFMLLVLGMFFGIFSLLSVGEAINIVEYKRRFKKKLPDSMVRGVIYIVLFAICALISIILILKRC